MPSPGVSVIMPVYNTSKYLGDAIQSILQQTFTNFEFIIINDGSSDDSERIILSFNDPRIRYLKNDENKGLVYTLNRGIDHAKAEWIARMDGDDLSRPDRFEKQWSYLREHPSVEILATTVTLINEDGKPAGKWNDDASAISALEIAKKLPQNNCIGHPTVFIRTSLLKKYRYNAEQSLSEDYDLWLRLAADGVLIHKLDQPLVEHRILTSSFTRSQKLNVFQKLAKVKYEFATKAISQGKRNAFVYKTLLFSRLDAIRGWLKKDR
jgi:glycosyltransferase involved in cell wall biosynthesis